MNERPTPETDAAAEEVGMGHFMVDCDHARKLERERDEAREAFVIATDQMVQAQCKTREALRERDEAWACCDELVVDSNAITLAKTVMRLERERDEAREVLREIAEASGFDNIGNWARKKARKEIDRYREKNDLLPISWDV